MNHPLRKSLAAIILLAIYHLSFAHQRVTAQARVDRTSLQTVQFHSALINATLPYNVILPRGYASAPVTRYPVLYLLHGLGGHYSDWATRTHLAEYATQYQMIIVMPEGNDGWYTDSATVPTDKYETYFLKELLPDVPKRYRTLETRFGRSIAGLSMGGYGAIKFGLKSPRYFYFCGVDQRRNRGALVD